MIRTLSVAFIDDDCFVLKLAERLFSELYPDVRIITYTSPKDFLKPLQAGVQDLPDLIFCDYNMPEMTGLEVHNALIPLSKHTVKHLEFYLISSQPNIDAVAMEFESDFFSGHYSKPLDTYKLCQILNQTQINLAS